MHKFLSKLLKSPLKFSLIIISCTVFLVFGITYPFILKMFANEVEKNTSERMQNALLRLDDNLNNIQNQIFSVNSNLDLNSLLTSEELSDYEQVALWNQITQSFQSLDYVTNYCLISKNSDKVLTSNGIYPFKQYLDRYWNNPHYDYTFWKDELARSFYIKYYPQAAYTSYAFGESVNTKTVIPIGFKSSLKQSYMIIAFVDFHKMCMDIDPYILENLSVFHKGIPLISCETNPLIDYEDHLKQSDITTLTTDDYLLTLCRSDFNDFIYVKGTPTNEIRSNLHFVYSISFCIIAVAILLCIGISYLLNKVVSPTISSIMEMLKNYHLIDEKNPDDVSYIENNIQNLFDSHHQIAKELEEKNLALSGFLYQSKLKNIYMNIKNPEDSEQQNYSYYLLSFQVIYREDMSAMAHKTYSEIAFILKEYLEQILNHYFSNILLFQTEENSFIAKVSGTFHELSIETIMENIKSQLNIEDSYCYFLIAVSNCIQDETTIAEDYYSLLEFQQHFCLKDSSQLLFKSHSLEEQKYISLKSQQTTALKKLILSGAFHDATQLILRMLDQHLTDKTTCLNATLLCQNIANILIQSLSEKFISLPGDLPIQTLYNQLSKCCNKKNYCDSLMMFAEQCFTYLSCNNPLEDPLIIGVKKYVAEHYSEEFTIEIMADTLKISKSYLSTYFKTNTGTNLLNYIQQYRIQKAIVLIQNSNTKLADIGNQVGIPNPNSFIRVFKKYTGTTPSEYRKNLNI